MRIKPDDRASFFSLEEDKDNFWFWDFDFVFEALCKIEKKSLELRRIGDASKRGSKALYNRIVALEDKIICIPWTADNIKIFNKTTGMICNISICEYISGRNRERILFRDAVIYGNLLIMSGYSNLILAFDYIKEKVEWSLALPFEAKNDDGLITLPGSLVKDELVVPLVDEPIVLRISLKDRIYSIHKIDGIEGGFFSSYMDDGEALWLIEQNRDEIIKLDSFYQVVKSIEISSPEGINRYGRWGEMFYFEGSIWCFKLSPEYLIRIDTKTGDSSFHVAYSDYMKSLEIDDINMKHPLAQLQKDRYIYTLIYPRRDFIRIDLMGDSIDIIDYDYTEEEEKDRLYMRKMSWWLKNGTNVFTEHPGELERYVKFLPVYAKEENSKYC